MANTDHAQVGKALAAENDQLRDQLSKLRQQFESRVNEWELGIKAKGKLREIITKKDKEIAELRDIVDGLRKELDNARRIIDQ